MGVGKYQRFSEQTGAVRWTVQSMWNLPRLVVGHPLAQVDESLMARVYQKPILTNSNTLVPFGEVQSPVGHVQHVSDIKMHSQQCHKII